MATELGSRIEPTFRPTGTTAYDEALVPAGWVTLRTGLNATTVCGSDGCVKDALADLRGRITEPAR